MPPSLALALLALAAAPAMPVTPAAPAPIDFAAEPSLARLRAVRFLPPPPESVLSHRHEVRGFVTVPMDYARPAESPKLRIFYRLMPARDPRAPLLVVVNGGPGVPSSAVRPYDHDYDRPQTQTRDRLGPLTERFRVLIADQRGTAGWSSALDLSDPALDAAVVARYFDAAHHARDLQEVIRAVVPEGEPFHLLAQSYAGLVGCRYLTLPEITRLPRGLVLSSAALPTEVVRETWTARRRSQRELHGQLLRAVPDVRERIAAVRARLAAAGLAPENVNHLWPLLGRGPAGAWEAALRDRLSRLQSGTPEELRAFVAEGSGQVNLLNYLLSAKELTPGYTDRTLAAHLVQAVPFDDWMLDEQWTLVRLGGDAPWVATLLDAVDRAPPPPLPFPPLPRLRELLARVPVLFTLGEGDAYIGEATARRNVDALAVPGRSQVRVLPGGHRAAFLPTGAEALSAWVAALPGR